MNTTHIIPEQHESRKVSRNRMIIYYLILIALLALWIPVSIDKIMDFAVFKASMLRQPFADSLGNFVAFALPPLEAATVLMLLFERSRKYGFLLSSGLLLVFSGYISVALMGAWEKLPCGCGSVISGLGWGEHLAFNVFFLAVSVIGYYLDRTILRSSKQ